MKRKSSKPVRSHPLPIRFDLKEREQIDQLARGTRLSITDIVRLSVRYSLPKFLSGEVSLRDLNHTDKQAA